MLNQSNSQPSDIDDMPDKELLALLQNPSYADFSFPNRWDHIKRITKDTILKYARDAATVDNEPDYLSEAFAHQLVSEQTSIPVPELRKVVKSTYSTFIAMEYKYSWTAALRCLPYFVVVWVASRCIYHLLLCPTAPQN